MSYSGDGLLWWPTKYRCSNLKTPHEKLQARIKACKKKGYQIGYKQKGSEYSFTVTDEKLQQMTDDGTLKQLKAQGVQVDGDADPLYFEWKNQVSKYEKNLPNRTLDTYKSTFPYLDLNALNSLSWFFSGQNFARQHEAALLWISQSQDSDLLKRVDEFYDRILLNLKKTNDSQKVAKAIIDYTWEKAVQHSGILGKILDVPKQQLENTAKNVKKMLEKEKEAISKRLKSTQTVLPFQQFFPNLYDQSVPSSDIVASNMVTEISKKENDNKNLKIAVGGLVGISALFLIYALVSE